MSLVSKCASFPHNYEFYLLPWECLQSVSCFQKQVEEISKYYAIDPPAYHVALCETASSGQIRVTEEILKLVGKELLEHGDVIGRTPLIWSIINCHYFMVKYLISVKANVNTSSEDGRTPLWYAAKAHQVRIIEVLLEKGAVAEAELDDTEMQLVERAQEAVNFERQKSLQYFHSLLDANLPIGIYDMHKLIISYADPLNLMDTQPKYYALFYEGKRKFCRMSPSPSLGSLKFKKGQSASQYSLA